MVLQHVEVVPAAIGIVMYFAARLLHPRLAPDATRKDNDEAQDTAKPVKTEPNMVAEPDLPIMNDHAVALVSEPAPEPQPERDQEDNAFWRDKLPAGRMAAQRLATFLTVLALASALASTVVIMVVVCTREWAPSSDRIVDNPTAIASADDLDAPPFSPAAPMDIVEAEPALSPDLVPASALASPSVTIEHAHEEPPTMFSVGLTRHSFPVNSVGHIVYYRSAYFGTLHVGTPPVPFKVVFDTGSGHLILPSTYCQSETCRAHRRYRRVDSATAKDIDYDGTLVLPGQPRDQITVSFGTGEVTGVFIEDVMCVSSSDSGDNALAANDTAMATSSIGTAEASGVAAARTPGGTGLLAWNDANADLEKGCVKLRLIAATHMSEEPFKSFQFDGVLGLGLEGLSQAPEFNFLNVIASSVLSQTPHTFSVFLGDDTDEGSKITFGGWDDKKLTEDLSWNPVIDPAQGHWTISIKALRVDDEYLDICDQGCKGVVDTGTSLLAVPADAFSELYTNLRHPAHLEGHCQGRGPKMHIELESFTITLEPQDYARLERVRESDKSKSRVWPSGSGHNSEFGEPRRSDLRCKPMLMSMDLPPPLGPKLFILGEPVLRKYYSVYDGKEKRVGFARARHQAPGHFGVTSTHKGNPGHNYADLPAPPKSMFDVFRGHRARR